jgi:YidC/Oxa1 family membrane protein insertase
MAGTMFWSQKQMMARNAAQMADNPMAQQQKVLLYAMPAFLAFISLNFPMGILLYWVTTNFWQVAQQAIILREVQHEVETGTLGDHKGGEAARKKPTKRNGPRARATGGTGSASSLGTGEGRRGPPGRAAGRPPGSGVPRTDPSRRRARPADRAIRAPRAVEASREGPTGLAERRDPRPARHRPSKKRDHLPRRGGGSPS